MARLYISIGSNVDKEHYIPKSLELVKTHFSEVTVSSVFESEAVGFNGNNFYNLVVACSTTMDLEQTYRLLKQIELDNGRTHHDKKFSPRTLDLDILLFDDMVCETPAQLPRDEITKNAFVLWPLAEIAPDLIHPTVKVSIGQLWQNYNKDSQKLWKVELDN